MAQSATSQIQDQLITQISTLLEPLGYEVVHLEVHTHRQKVLRLFIDHLSANLGAIGIEDCATVSRALNEPLDQMPDVDHLFHGSPYELEVSSPGVDRPLRQAKDFTRFAGKEARIHTFRPLSVEEIENPDHLKNHPKQKNFLGVLKGLKAAPGSEPNSAKVLIQLSESGDAGKPGKKGKTKKSKSSPQSEEAEEAFTQNLVAVPLSLISKAHLEPRFDLNSESETEISLDAVPGSSKEETHQEDERYKE